MIEQQEIERYQRLKSLFELGLEVSPELRTERLVELCPDDPSLRAEAVRLLSLHYQAGGLLDGVSASDEPPTDLPRDIGPFHIRGLLGWGAMGVVYLAEDRRTHVDRGRISVPSSGQQSRPVALKVFRGGALFTGHHRRFQQEEAILKRLNHPGIARFFDAGVFDHECGPIPYVAMHYVEGQSLRSHIGQAQPNTAQRLTLIAEIADALDYAHSQGVVHRDLKPENIVIAVDGRPCILDFGVARLTEAENPEGTLLTRVGQLVGTPQYMSPEQAEASGEPVDGRSDIYSLGVIGYELLAGKPPYEASGDSLHRAVVTILTAEPTPLSTVASRFKGTVDEIIARALEKNPDERYPTGADMARDIRNHLEGRRVAVKKGAGRRALERRARARRGWVLTAALVPIALAAGILIAGFKPGLWLSEPDAFMVLAPRLERANDLLHSSRRNRGEILDAIAILRSCQEDLARMPPPPFVGHLEKFVHWRLGEAQYFLGGEDHDPRAYRDAFVAWGRAGVASENATHMEMMNRERQIFYEIARLGRHHPSVGQALALRALAEYEAPAMNLARVTELLEEARGHHRAQHPPNYDPLYGPSASERRDDIAMILNDLGESIVMRGSRGNDLARIDQGIEILAQADSTWSTRTPRSPLGSFLLHCGTAWRCRAELTGRLADLDSARARLQAGLAIRTAAESPRNFIRFQAELARTDMLQSQLVRDHSERRRHLERAIYHLGLARGIPAAESDHALRAELDLLRAEGLADLALLAASSAPTLVSLSELLRNNLDSLFTDADSLVSSAAQVFTREHFMLKYAALERVRGHVFGSRWRVFGREHDRKEAEAALELARDLIPGSDDRRHERLVAAEVAALEDRVLTRTASTRPKPRS